MKIYPECITCQIRVFIKLIISSTDDQEKINKASRDILSRAAGFRQYPHLFDYFYVLQNDFKRNFPGIDTFKEYKNKFNRICLDLENKLHGIIKKRKNKFETALKICIAGNSIDISHGGETLEQHLLMDQIEQVLEQDLNPEAVKELENEIKKAGKILLIGDNAGEIVLDKIFIEVINELFPGKDSILYCVRGGYTLNDSTIEDAEMTGIKTAAEIITTGSDICAAYLPQCSEEFREHYRNADLVISKGVANLECLYGEEKNIFFLFKLKCPVLKKIFNLKGETGQISLEKNIKGYDF